MRYKECYWQYGRVWVLLLASLFISACASNTGSNTGDEAMAMVAVEVSYRERMLLPAEAQVEVQLLDVSRADASATVLARAAQAATKAPPYHFELTYPESSIQPGHRYSLRATVRLRDRLLFGSTRNIDPFAGEQPVQVPMQRMVAPAVSGGSLLDVQWQLVELNGEVPPVSASGEAASLRFDGRTGRAGGYAGCNRYAGTYDIDKADNDGALSFGPIAGTRRACMQGMDLEQRYLDTLARVERYALADQQLSLYAGNKIVALFRSDQ
ncbi:MAG: YbaY family lipoprotein [Parahaliea sp.]